MTTLVITPIPLRGEAGPTRTTRTTRTTDTIADLLGWDDTGLASVEARLVLGTAVSELSERERRILQWRCVDERTQQEIADLVGLTQAQVSGILTRVLARLRAGSTEPQPAA